MARRGPLGTTLSTTTARAVGGRGTGGGSGLTLDNVTSAVLAWSVARKLRTDHSGSLIRVRRSSDSTETDIGAASNVLDESALTTHTGSGNGFLTTYYDQSGHASAVDFVQATTTLQPRIVNAGTIDKLGGKPTSKQSSASSPIGYCESNNWGTRPSSAVAFLVSQRGSSNQAFITTRNGAVFGFYAANGQPDAISGNIGASSSVDLNGSLIATTGVQNRDQLWDSLPVSGLFIATMRNLDLSNAAFAYIRQGRAFDVASLGIDSITEFIVLSNPTTDEINTVESDIAAFYGVTLT